MACHKHLLSSYLLAVNVVLCHIPFVLNVIFGYIFAGVDPFTQKKINEQLGKINGFGPFTCANVLMCLGFYHVIPSDSETLRHINQVHGKKSTIKYIQEDIERIYGKYAPFQFLVYWSEIWSFYEERFGKLSELPNSHYKLITAANMKCKNE